MTYWNQISSAKPACQGKLSARWQGFLDALPEPLFKLLTGHKRDVLFVWIPKCAGSSIYRILIEYGCAQCRWFKPLEPFRNKGMVTFGHVNVAQLAEQGVLTPKYFGNAFKFAFVRNPFDRMVSLFVYLKQNKYPDVPESMSFAEFCRKIERREHPPVGLYNFQGLSQCNPMVDWLVDRQGRFFADFVGRQENLAEDFLKFCRAAGFPPKAPPHINKTDHRPYQEYYTPETRAIVERVYRADLDRFGYSF